MKVAGEGNIQVKNRTLGGLESLINRKQGSVREWDVPGKQRKTKNAFTVRACGVLFFHYASRGPAYLCAGRKAAKSGIKEGLAVGGAYVPEV